MRSFLELALTRWSSCVSMERNAQPGSAKMACISLWTCEFVHTYHMILFVWGILWWLIYTVYQVNWIMIVFWSLYGFRFWIKSLHPACIVNLLITEISETQYMTILIDKLTDPWFIHCLFIVLYVNFWSFHCLWAWGLLSFAWITP